ncbi:MAG: hypothetical protein ACFFDT_36090 [Candidatus Hodarchaeota archaeon]
MALVLPKWYNIAKTEYRVRINMMPGIKRVFPYLAIGGLATYVFWIAPFFIDLFMDIVVDEFLSLLISHAAVAMVEVILFMIFINFLLFPISLAMKDVQTEQIEIFLTTPIKPSDVLLGEFLGKMPFYAIFIVLITGLFTSMLAPLGLDIIQILIIIAIFINTFLSAYWIGTVIATFLRAKLGKIAGGKDIGKAVAMLIVLPSVALFYALLNGNIVNQILDKSGTVEIILGLLPSSWGAEVIVNFARNPGNITVNWLETVFRLSGLSVFFIGILWLGTKVADHTYALEAITFTTAKAKPEGIIYKIIRRFGREKSFGIIVISILKDFGRRFENISKIIYILGLLFCMNVFLAPEAGFKGGVMMTLIITGLLTSMVCSEVTLRGKESLFIYKKAPNGIKRLIWSRLVMSAGVILPIVLSIAIVLAFLSPETTIEVILKNSIMLVLCATAFIVFSLGLFTLNPAYSDKDGNYILNIMIGPQLSVGIFIISLIVFDNELMSIPILWCLAIVILFLGNIRLNKLE